MFKCLSLQISLQHALHIRSHPSMRLPSDIYCVGQNRCEDFLLCFGGILVTIRGGSKLLCHTWGKFYLNHNDTLEKLNMGPNGRGIKCPVSRTWLALGRNVLKCGTLGTHIMAFSALTLWCLRTPCGRSLQLCIFPKIQISKRRTCCSYDYVSATLL